MQRERSLEARELLAQGIDPKVQRNATRGSQTSGDGTHVRERGHRPVRAEEGLRHAGVRRRQLGVFPGSELEAATISEDVILVPRLDSPEVAVGEAEGWSRYESYL